MRREICKTKYCRNAEFNKMEDIPMLKNNKKGFSLVELIIVIAIMVALVAVMAPAFVKYVKSSREATMKNAVESVVEFAKSEIAVGNLTLDHDKGQITVTPSSDKIYVDLVKGIYKNSTNTTFSDGCGVEGGSASTTKYTINIEMGSDGNAVFSSVTADIG